LNSGNLVGLVQLRDDVAVGYQRQLDDLARGLIEAFKETKTGLADQAGVFTDNGSSTLPNTLTPAGLAARITVHPKAEIYENIRDNTINGTAYKQGDGTASFSGRLYQLVAALETPRDFDPSFGLGSKMTIQDFASSSAGWIEAKRQDASQQFSYQETLLSQASEALSNATDVNMDDETALMLQLEKSYSASAKLISVIDQMLKTLLNAVG